MFKNVMIPLQGYSHPHLKHFITKVSCLFYSYYCVCNFFYVSLQKFQPSLTKYFHLDLSEETSISNDSTEKQNGNLRVMHKFMLQQSFLHVIFKFNINGNVYKNGKVVVLHFMQPKMLRSIHIFKL